MTAENGRLMAPRSLAGLHDGEGQAALVEPDEGVEAFALLILGVKSFAPKADARPEVHSLSTVQEVAMTRFVVLALVALVAPCLGLAQAAAYQVPKPGPEHEKLGVLVGNWTGEGECVESPFGAAEKWATKIKADWFEGKAAVVRHAGQKGSISGEIAQLEVLTYDSAPLRQRSCRFHLSFDGGKEAMAP